MGPRVGVGQLPVTPGERPPARSRWIGHRAAQGLPGVAQRMLVRPAEDGLPLTAPTRSHSGDVPAGHGADASAQTHQLPSNTGLPLAAKAW